MFRPRGALRAGTVATLQEAIAAAVAAGAIRIELEMDGLDFVDSRGLGFLYTLRHRGRPEPAVRIRGASPRLARLLRRHRAHCLWDD